MRLVRFGDIRTMQDVEKLSGGKTPFPLPSNIQLHQWKLQAHQAEIEGNPGTPERGEQQTQWATFVQKEKRPRGLSTFLSLQTRPKGRPSWPSAIEQLKELGFQGRRTRQVLRTGEKVLTFRPSHSATPLQSTEIR